MRCKRRAKILSRRSGATQDACNALDVNALLDFERWLQQLQRLISHPLNPRLVADDALSRYLAAFKRRRQAA